MKTLFTLLLATLISNFSFSQKLETNKIDQFTKDTLKITSWELLERSGAVMKVQGAKINSTRFLRLKMYLGSRSFAMSKGDKMMFMLENDEIIEIENIEFTFSDWNGSIQFSREFIEVAYYLDSVSFEKLKNNNVKKVRVYTTDGFVEDSISRKNSKHLNDVLKLIE